MMNWDNSECYRHSEDGPGARGRLIFPREALRRLAQQLDAPGEMPGISRLDPVLEPDDHLVEVFRRSPAIAQLVVVGEQVLAHPVVVVAQMPGHVLLRQHLEAQRCLLYTSPSPRDG